MEEQEIKNDPVLAVVAEQLRKSKAELVSDIEGHLSELLGMDVKHAFEKVATTQQIRGGAMNIDRAHKSALVLIVHALSLIKSQSQN
jgi:hypothetical protein